MKWIKKLLPIFDRSSLGWALPFTLLLGAAAPLPAQKFFPNSPHGVPNSYIVLLPSTTVDSEVAYRATQLTATYGGQVGVRWKTALRGFMAQMNARQAQRMSQDPGVVGVYQNRRLEGSEALDRGLSNATPYCYGVESQGFPQWPPGDTVTFSSPIPTPPPTAQSVNCANPDPGSSSCLGNWGIDRLDDFTSQRDGDWAYKESGNGVRIYIQDTGVRNTHKEFDSTGPPARVESGIDATLPHLPGGDPDCSQPAGPFAHPHGTHVATIAGGSEFGVAKQSRIVPVRQFSGLAPNEVLMDEYIITALECIALDQGPGANTAIVNLSGLNDEYWALSAPFQQAVIGVASRDNILFVQAAGNFYPADACTKTFGDESAFTGSDAEAIGRILVAAGSDEADHVWTYSPGDGQSSQTGSDLGPCVDLFAPADHIVAGWWENPDNPNQPNSGVCRLAGTSMAAPHVAGVAAMMLESKRDATAPELRGDLLDHALRNRLTFDTPTEATSPNLLLHRDDNRIFFNGFHHDLSRWWTGGSSAALSHCNWTGNTFGGGSTAVCVDLGQADGWLEDRRPKNESSYDFYFRFDFTDAQIQSEHVFFEGRTSSGALAFRLKVRPSLASGHIDIGFFASDNGGLETSVWAQAPAQQGHLRGRWKAATSGTLDAAIGISPDGPEAGANLVIGNNSNRLVNEVRLGAIGTPAKAVGTQRFRQFRSWRNLSADLDRPAFDP